MVIDPLILGDKPNEIFGFRNGMDDHGTFGFVWEDGHNLMATWYYLSMSLEVMVQYL